MTRLGRKGNDDHGAIEIVPQHGNAVLVSAEDYAALREGSYLLRSPDLSAETNPGWVLDQEPGSSSGGGLGGRKRVHGGGHGAPPAAVGCQAAGSDPVSSVPWQP